MAIKEYKTDNIHINFNIVDSDGSYGTSGQVLSRDAGGVTWINGSAIPGGVSGTGTTGVLPMFTDGPNGIIGDSNITKTGSNGYITIKGATNDMVVKIDPDNNAIGDTAKITFNDRAMVGWFNSAVYLGDNGQNKDIKLQVNTGNINMMTSNTTRMLITPTGNVGIGTTGPIQKLDTPNIVIGGPTIVGTYRANALFIDNNGGTSRFYSAGANTTTKGGYVFHNMSSDATINPEVLTILPSGNVGIGVTNPAQKLDVAGKIVSSIDLTVGNNSSGAVRYSGQNGYYSFITRSNYNDWVLSLLGTDGDASTDPIGNQLMTVNYNGNVGIGTTSPIAKLHVEGDKSYSLGYLDKTSDLHIGNDTMSSAVGAYAGSITFGSTSESNLQAASIVAVQTDTDPNEIGLAFFTQHSSAGSTDLLESMRIKNDGNVGIGTTNPLNKLFVSTSTAGDYAGFIENTNSTNGYGLLARTAHTGASAYAFAARAGTSDIFVVRGDGNVGIGVTGPTAKLTLADHTTPAGGIKFRTAASSVSLWSSGSGNLNTDVSFNVGSRLRLPGGNGVSDPDINFTGASSGTGFSRAANDITFITSATERMRIDSSGNVLIGVTSALGRELLVKGEIAALNNTGTNDNQILMAVNNTIGNLAVTYASTGSYVPFQLETSGSPRFTVSTAGAIKFNAYGAGTLVTDASGNITASSGGGAGGPYLPLIGGIMTGAGQIRMPDNFQLQLGTSADMEIYHNGTNTIFDNQTGALIIQNNTSERMRITSAGDVGIGTTSPQELLDVNTNPTGLNVDNTAAIFGNDIGTTQSRDTWIKLRASSQTTDKSWAFGTQQDGDFRFNYLGDRTITPTNASASTLLTIKNTGNVGIGTTNPLRKLDLIADLSTDAVRIKNTNSNGGGLSVFAANSGGGSNRILTLGDSSENIKVSVIENGNVGIGTTLPTSKLHSVVTTAGDSALKLQDDTGSVFDFQCGIAGVTGDALVIKDTSLSYDYLTLRSGNVGIGVTSPSAKLHVHATSGDGKLRVSGDNIENSGGELKGFNNGFAFNVAPSGGGTYVERMRINGSGNVGIGVANPETSRLLVRGSTNDSTSLIFQAANLAGASRYAIRPDGDNKWYKSDNSLSMILTSAGNVGIGTTSPGEKLTVISSTANTWATSIENTAANGTSFGLEIVAGSNNGDKALAVRNKSSSDLMVVRGDGNVGIGTASPSNPLEISSDTSTSLVYQRTGVSAKKWGFHSDNDATYWQNVTSGSLLFTLQNGGNVGIGTTSPGAKLDVKKGSEGLYFAAGGDTGNARSLQFTSSANLGSNGAMHTINAVSGNGAIALATASAERMRITAAGGISFGSTGTAYGTSGQVLTSDGNASPTWTTPSAGGDIDGTATDTYVSYGSGPDTITAQADFAFVTSVANAKRLRLMNSVIQTGTISATASGALVGSIRYRTFSPQVGRTQSTVEVCVQTGASTYIWTALYTSSMWS